MNYLRQKLIPRKAVTVIFNKNIREVPVRAEVLEALQEGGQQLQPVAVLWEYTNLFSDEGTT